MTANTEIEGLVARLEKAHRATAGEENRRTIREAAEALAALEARVGELERQVKEANGWTLEMSIYEGFSTEIWADGREPGQRTVAIVRDYRDAVFILAAIARATQAEARLAEAVAVIRRARTELECWRILVSEGGVPRYTITPGAGLNSVVESSDGLIRRTAAFLASLTPETADA